jgi:hypothetical protein
MEPRTQALSSKDDEPLQSQSLSSKDDEPLQSQSLSSRDEELVSTLETTDKIFKIVPHKKPKKIITPEEKLERYKRTCINFLNKINGIIVEKPTIDEVKKRNRQNKANFKELHKTAYHTYINDYMRHYMREKNRNDKAYRNNELARKKLIYDKLKKDKLLQSNEIINNP